MRFSSVGMLTVQPHNAWKRKEEVTERVNVLSRK